MTRHYNSAIIWDNNYSVKFKPGPATGSVPGAASGPASAAAPIAGHAPVTPHTPRVFARLDSRRGSKY